MLQSNNKKQKVRRHIHRCPSQRSVQFTCIIGERASVAVKNEPPLLPGLDLSSHFDQIATAGLLRDGQVVARVCAVARRLNVSPQVKVVLSYWQVPGQRAGLEAQKSLSLGTGRLSDWRFSQQLIAQRTKFSLGGRYLNFPHLCPLFFAQFHLTLDELLPPARLFLKPFLQLLPSFSLLLEGLLSHVHLSFLNKPVKIELKLQLGGFASNSATIELQLAKNITTTINEAGKFDELPVLASEIWYFKI